MKTASAWSDVSLGDICEFKYGKALSADTRSGKGYNVYGSNGTVGKHSDAITNGPTIIVGRKGSLGEVAYSPEPCWPIDTTYYIDGKSTKADLRWLAYRLRGLRLTELNRAAAIPGLNREDAYRIRLLFPPYDEQRRIADILDRADALRAKRRAALARLDELTQAIFIDMFGDPIENTHRLPVRQMIEIVDPNRPITYGILMPGPDQSVGVPYVRVVDMKEGSIQVAGIRKTTEEISNAYRRSLLKSGDLIMSIRGHVGRMAEVPPALDGANITQDTARLAITGAIPLYVRECLRTIPFQRWMAKHTKGVAVQGINLGDVKRMPIILPPPHEQKRFVDAVEVIEREMCLYRMSLTHLDALFSSLQDRAFRDAL